MGEWHLEELRNALLNRGWKVTPDLPGDDYKIASTWRVVRGDAVHILAFQAMDGAGELLPLDKSYACQVQDAKSLSLYFYRKSSPRWKPDLLEFVVGLDALR